MFQNVLKAPAFRPRGPQPPLLKGQRASPAAGGVLEAACCTTQETADCQLRLTAWCCPPVRHQESQRPLLIHSLGCSLTDINVGPQGAVLLGLVVVLRAESI
jgi:hypothetical protein